MATLNERNILRGTIRDQVRIALAAALTDILLETDNAADDDDERKARQIKQEWALSSFHRFDAIADQVILMVASKAPDAQIASGGALDDAEITSLVEIATTVLAGVNLKILSYTLPA